MSLDVVKSKSILKQVSFKSLRILLIITILGSWMQTLKKVFNYCALSNKCLIIVNEIYWQKPDIKITFTKYGETCEQESVIPLLKVHSKEHFETIKLELKEKLNEGFYKKNDKKKVVISRPFPFKKIIYSTLLSLSYLLLNSYMPRQSKGFIKNNF